MIERTLMIIKPDAVGQRAIGQILARVEEQGFAICEMRLERLGRKQAEEFYAVHRERPFFSDLVKFMSSGPALPVVLERDNAVAYLRAFIGPTDSAKAPRGTIRGDFGTNVQCNAVHASDSPENAAREIAFFFGA
jgi:nucleoside-diphosphate kinase